PGTHLRTAVAIVDGNSANMLGNYNVTLVNDTSGVIGAKAITVAAAANTKQYDGNTSASAMPTIDPALVGGDTSGFVETYDTPDPGTGKTLTPAGSANDGNSGSNYSVTFVNDTTGVINFKMVTILSGLTANGKVYDQTNTATLSSNNVVLDGVASGDAANVALSTNGYTATFADANVGEGKT